MSFLITNTVGTSLAPAPLRKTSSLPLYLGSVQGQKGPLHLHAGAGLWPRVCGLVSGSSCGPGAHPSGSSYSSARGGGRLERGRGRGGFRVWREKEKEGTDDLLTSLPVSGREKESETHLKKRHRWNLQSSTCTLYPSLLLKDSSLFSFKVLEPQKPF